MFGFTGNDLKILRGALSLNRKDFAQHLQIEASYVRKAERFEDEEIPVDDEFQILFGNLCYAAPRMIMIRFDHIRRVQEVLQGLAQKLQKVDKFIHLGKDSLEEEDEVKEEVEEEEKEERKISATTTDKRSVSLDDA